MTDNIDLTAVSIPPRSGVAKQLVVFLHGYGADGNDLLSLAPVFADRRFPDCAYAAPHAPFPCEVGFGRQWFSLHEWSLASLGHGVDQALPILNRYLDGEMAKWNVDSAHTAVIGFSQGTMMALAAGLRRESALGGIVGFSGVLVNAGSLTKELRSRPPVLLVHGDADEVVPFAALAQAESALRQAEIPVQTLTCPRLGHGIDSDGINAAIAFLHKIWG